MTTRLDNAIWFMLSAFHGQFDWAGLPVAMHSMQVMNTVNPATESNKIVGVLHDILEDTKYKVDDLIAAIGLNEEEEEALVLLTHAKHVPHKDYVRRIRDSKNEIAFAVKLADIKHNSSRNLDKLPEETAIRLKNKYDAALKILTGEMQ